MPLKAGKLSIDAVPHALVRLSASSVSIYLIKQRHDMQCVSIPVQLVLLESGRESLVSISMLAHIREEVGARCRIRISRPIKLGDVRRQPTAPILLHWAALTHHPFRQVFLFNGCQLSRISWR